MAKKGEKRGKREERGERGTATLSQRRERKGAKGMSEGDGGDEGEGLSWSIGKDFVILQRLNSCCVNYMVTLSFRLLNDTTSF